MPTKKAPLDLRHHHSPETLQLLSQQYSQGKTTAHCGQFLPEVTTAVEFKVSKFDFDEYQSK
ncbi:hypothetical protein [Janthinobacterium sp. 75]|uniref:hypothetical protein n=1 Tax=Janthinobacterium sp. 75 TaxID=2135628 RepID=UPI0010634382|nr:hypothetical protein [Janthinobacterium sp. 75]